MGMRPPRVFSGQPLGCYGDGGAVFTQDDELALINSIRLHGKGERNMTMGIGVNSRLDTIKQLS